MERSIDSAANITGNTSAADPKDVDGAIRRSWIYGVGTGLGYFLAATLCLELARIDAAPSSIVFHDL